MRWTRGKGSYGLVKARYIRNRSQKTGRHVTGDLQRLIYYNVYGDGKKNPDHRPRGPIYDENGMGQKYGEYKAWAIGRSSEAAYTYRMIISPKGKILSDADFVESIRTTAAETGVGEAFRVVIHRDTDHTHAHLIFQTDKTMKRRELEDWKATVRSEMIEREEARAKALGIKVPKVGEDDGDDLPVEAKPSSKKRGGKAAEDEFEHKPSKQNSGQRRRRRSRSKSQSNGLG